MEELANRDFTVGAKARALSPEDRASLLEALGASWSFTEDEHLRKEFRFGDFMSGLRFVEEVAEIAEGMNHHPDVELSYGKVSLEIWTHTLCTLSDADFVFAARVEGLRPSSS